MKPVLIVAVIGELVVIGWLGFCLRAASQQMREEQAARKIAEQDAIEEAQFGVQAQREKGEIQAQLEAMTATNTDLASEVERLKALVRVRPVSVASGTTGPRDCEGEPREPPAGQPVINAIDSACLLAAGDRAELRIDEAEFRTEQGNTVLVGAGSAYRVHPPPVTRLVHGAFVYDLTEADRELTCPPPAPAQFCAPAWSLALSAGAGVLLTAGLVAAVR